MLLHSNIIGEGHPFVILHGFLGMGDNWKTHGKNFADLGYEVHLVDQRNHGHSFHDNVFSYEVLAEDLKNYCEAKKSIENRPKISDTEWHLVYVGSIRGSQDDPKEHGNIQMHWLIHTLNAQKIHFHVSHIIFLLYKLFSPN